ncbi:cyclin-domain-containing protein [Russula earlei]|uniref:Cyclin-domain-containing protein n=1 Tax=Russula earlei TaxID=71964 RepID=A0ACC0UI03_9AGAM|nr:cyclin-domain-containing protein [Russula earlei]
MESSRRVGLPPAYEDADIDALCQLIALMLDRLISINDRIPLSPESISRFHSASVPQISILDYLRRIVRFTNLEKTCLLLILHYIDQICARETFTISSLTVHRFIITVVSLSSKSHCDAFCTNAHYARVGGVAPAELARLERAFLAAIDWRLACTREVLQLYYVNLVAHSGGRFHILSEEENDDDLGDVTHPAPSPAAATPGSSSSPAAAGVPTSPAGSITSDRQSTSRGPTASPAVVPAAGPPPPIGGPGMGAPAPSVEQNMAFAQFQQRTQGER